MNGVCRLVFLMCQIAVGFMSGDIVPTFHLQEDVHDGFEIERIPRLFHDNSNSKTRYKLLSQKLAISSNGLVFDKRASKQHKYVELDGKSGRLTLVNEIDRDEVCGKVKICAIKLQMIQLPQQKLIEINLIIDDVNDNSPIFPNKIIEISVAENMAIGETYNLDSFMATDKDSELNGEIEYTMTKNQFFILKDSTTLSENGHLQIQLVKSLDYEYKPLLELTLVASDKGEVTHTTRCTLQINIVDVNDNRPVFQQDKYTVTLLENSLPGQEVVTVEADDADSGVHGQIKYYLSQRNDPRVARLVAIDSLSGVVTLKEKLDRERDDGIRVIVAARDSSITGQQKTGEAYVIINIEDVNDNAPDIYANYVVTSENNTAYVVENSVNGTYIVRVTTNDADVGNNGRVQLSIVSSPFYKCKDVSSPPKFELKANGFIETTGSLDQEQCNKYYITITACDQGQLQKCSSLKINVIVLDENEHAPKFIIPKQRVVLSENANIGTKVAEVRAIDGDAIGGKSLQVSEDDKIIPSRNGVVTYSIVNGGGGAFNIDKHSGRIQLARKLDRETQHQWKLQISAQDGGSPVPLEGFCDVIVQIDDVNDNKPYFVNPAVNNSLIHASIYHETPITTLKAIDLDVNMNSKLTYKILRVDSDVAAYNDTMLQATRNINNQRFMLNPRTGQLLLNYTKSNHTSSPLGLYKLRIQVCDSGTPKLCSRILLRVMVTDQYNLNLMANNTVGSLDEIMLIGIIGSVFIAVIILVVLIAIRCKSKEQDKMREQGRPSTNRSEYSLDACDNESIEVDEAELQRLQSQESEMDTASSNRPRSIFTENHDRHFLYPNYNSKQASTALSDGGDSGRGDSESDHIANFNANEQRASQMTTDQLDINTNYQVLPNQDGIGSNSSVATVRNEKFYNWEKMKPRLYESPPHHVYDRNSRYSASELMPHRFTHDIVITDNEANLNMNNYAAMQRRYSTAILQRDISSAYSPESFQNNLTHRTQEPVQKVNHNRHHSLNVPITITDRSTTRTPSPTNRVEQNDDTQRNSSSAPPSGVLGKFGRNRRSMIVKTHIKELLV